jgi:hypothetical protein
MPSCFVVLEDHSTPWSNVASFNTTEQCGIVQYHGAAWHATPRADWHPKPQSSVACNTTEQRGILQDSKNTWIQRCSVVLKDATLLHGVE